MKFQFSHARFHSLQFLLVFVLFFSARSTLAGNDGGEEGAAEGKRPAVGLVLSGGGAKGFAYIGLLRVIREAGLPIDYIGGSSIGSIMGGLYAIGYSPDTIAKLIRTQNWDDLLKDNMPRKYVAYEEKGIHEKTIVTLPLRNKKIGIGSMYQGQEISLLLNNYFSPAYKTTDFTKLPIPFLCIGTDLITGQEVVMKKGYLPGAIRASMSIPGYFEPVDYDGYYLVDGGVVNNYPVKEVKEMGAQIILGGDVQSGLYKTKAELQSITAILDQITSYARIGANEIGDSLTNLKVRFNMSYGLMDFDKYDSIIALGERVARSHFREIKALADSLNAIEYRPVNRCTASPLKKIRVDSLAIRDNVKLSDKYFLSIFGNYKGRDVSMEELERDIRMTYGSGYFQKVTYELDYSGGKTTLVIHALEAGPGAFSAGIHYDTDYGICLLLGGAFRNVLGRNSKLFAELNIAVNPRLKITYYYGFGGHGSVAANAEAYSFKVDVYDKDQKVNTLNMTNYTFAPFFNYNFRNMVNLKTGFQYEYFRFRQDFNLDSIAEAFEQFTSYGNFFFSLNADTRDKPVYPAHGIKAAFKVEYIMPFSKNWTSELFTNTLLFSLKFNQNIPLSKRFVLQPGLFAAAMLKSDYSPPVQHTFGLGGLMTDNYIESFVPFTGLQFIQKFGYYSLVGRMKLQYNVFGKIYAIIRTDAGANEFQADELFAQRNFLFGYGLTAGYDSFIGPLEVSIMGSNLNPGPTFFLSLGFPF